MTILVIVLIVIILILIATIIKFKRELKYIVKQIDKSSGRYINIRTKILDNDVENVVSRINYLYDENQKVNAEKRRIEEEIRHSIANMSHDLRTPLTSIVGYIQLIKADNTTEDERKEYLGIVENRTKSLQGLISSFYDLSRLEGNEYSFSYKKVSLEKVLSNNLALYYTDFMNKGIEPIIEIDENTPLIISDENAVNRVFSNLIGNMLKHGQEYIKITLKKKDGYILSEFINSAPTLKEDQVDKLFDRFFTADKSRSDKNTGLGLCITKALVDQLGNEIKAELVNSKLNISIKWKI